ncbi:transcription elongation factor GreA [Nocardioides sp. Kera G14]|uniref:transcription elongation factor GreA n=1 Tax=Nocardioides sp. Kera G14 TaxID=2884264 RepID=UPI001D0F9F59|nr:transcription elongation factor GreA [Nocardioides sp. Kera G14]UDY22963.1 transcription elongation factor GreA [Nocardioides sp. Kera G14]
MTQQTETPSSSTVWLSKDAYRQLTAKLEDMKGPQRDKIVAEISAARDEGDLKENGGYHAAREAQGRLEGEIAALHALLLKVDTTEPVDDGIVGPGKIVTFKFEGDDDDEAETRLIASIEMSDFADGIEISSPQSPVGEALLGATAGDVVTFEGPRGPLKVEVLKVVPLS